MQPPLLLYYPLIKIKFQTRRGTPSAFSIPTTTLESEESPPLVKTISTLPQRLPARSKASVPTASMVSIFTSSEILLKAAPQLDLTIIHSRRNMEALSLKKGTSEIWETSQPILLETHTCASLTSRSLSTDNTRLWEGQWWFTNKKTI